MSNLNRHRLEQFQVSMPTILIVEDEKNMAFALKEFFEAHEYKAFNVFNGLDGVRALRTMSIDLIITDINMPEMNGLEFVSKVRAQPNGENMPIIVVSGNTDDQTVMRGLELGANDYVTKPFKFRELFFKVKNLLGVKNKLESVNINSNSVDIIEIIKENMSRPDFSLDDFAEALHCSTSTAQRKLKKVSSHSFSQQVLLCRLEASREHIINYPDHSLSQIAEKFGFNSLSYFSTAFKNHFGCVPSSISKS
jgi:DNA-binding response OmpR family regulator